MSQVPTHFTTTVTLLLTNPFPTHDFKTEVNTDYYIMIHMSLNDEVLIICMTLFVGLWPNDPLLGKGESLASSLSMEALY